MGNALVVGEDDSASSPRRTNNGLTKVAGRSCLVFSWQNRIKIVDSDKILSMSLDQKLVKNFTTPWKLRLWMLKNLPMGFLSGMYIQSLDGEGCEVVLKARWWIRNPFGSVFWAVMGMAAELSTGALVYAHARGNGVKFILIGMEATFFKKVKGKSSYFCHHGSDVLRSLEQMTNPDDTIVVILPVTAKDEDGQLLAEFKFQWQLRKPMY